MFGLGTVVGLLIALALAAVAVGVVISLASAYDALLSLRTNIDRSWSNLNGLLKQRHDELPKLIETCRSYMPGEQKPLQVVSEARAAYARAGNISTKAQADELLAGALSALFAAAEKYSDLKVDTGFRQLRARVVELAERIDRSRESFNEDVDAFNLRLRRFPDALIARLMKLEPYLLFQPTELFLGEKARRA